MTLSTQIVFGAWLVWLVVWFIASLGAKRSVYKGWSWLVIRIAFIILVLYLANSRGVHFTGLEIVNPSFNPTPTLAALGAILTVLGVALAIWARVYLGRNWGMPMSRRVEPELVTTGPYSYIRHPIYTGVLLALLGSALAVGPWWFIPFIGAGAYFIYSATVEERHMAREFPNTYPPYKKRTKMLIPFLL